MFRSSWMSPAKVEGTLRLKKQPGGMGHYKDVDGVTWDIRGVFWSGKSGYVQARKISDSSGYYSTAVFSSCVGFHTWKSYYVEVVKEDRQDVSRET